MTYMKILIIITLLNFTLLAQHPIEMSDTCVYLKSEEEPKKLNNDVQKVIDEMVTPNGFSEIEIAGKELTFESCGTCHIGTFEGFNFFRNEETLTKKINNDEDFIKRVKQRMDSGSMPPNKELSEEEQLAISDYLETLVSP